MSRVVAEDPGQHLRHRRARRGRGRALDVAPQVGREHDLGHRSEVTRSSPWRARGPRSTISPVITRLEIENFKAIRTLSIDLGPLTVLVGPNDSGKSTILQALELLGRTVTRPIWEPGESSVFDTDPAELLTDLRDDLEMRFVVTGVLGGDDPKEYRYELGFQFRGGHFLIRKEQLRLGSSLSIDNLGGQKHTHLGQLANVADTKPVADELSSFLVAIEPHQLTLPCGPFARLESSGFGLPALVDHLLTDIDRTGRDRYDKALGRFSPNLTTVGARALPTQEKELVFGLTSRKPVPAREVSSGLLMAAVYVALEHLPYARFLVEEPENGVHPRAMLLIADVLRDLARGGRQVVMTTHSPILLNYMDAEDVQVVTRRGGNVQVMPITKTPHFDDRRRDFDLGELWYAIGEDELVSNAS